MSSGDADHWFQLNGNFDFLYYHSKEEYSYPAIDTPLYNAVHCGDLNLVLSLLDQISLKEKCEKRSLLHTAAARGQTEIVHLFCQRNFPTDKGDNSGNTPLHLAIIENHPSVFNILITRSNLNATNFQGESPLHIALKKEHIEFAEILLKNGANVDIQDKGGQTPLHIAAAIKSIHLVNILLGKGAKVNTNQNHRNWTPIHFAASVNDVNMVESLLKNGAKFVRGTENLNFAVRNRNFEMVKLLMTNGCNAINVQDCTRETALSLAVNDNDLKMVKYLVEHGSKIPLKNVSNSNRIYCDLESEKLLKRCLCTGSIKIWKYLLTCSSTIDGIADSRLHSAVRAGDAKTVKKIVRKRTIEKDSIESKLAVYIAVENGDEEILKILLKAGYSVESCFRGRSPLHVAATFNHSRLVEMLLEAGADLNSPTDANQIPLHFAAAALQPTVVKFLLEAGSDFSKYKAYDSPLTYTLCRGHEIENYWTITPLEYKNVLNITEMLLIAATSEANPIYTFYEELFLCATKIRVFHPNKEKCSSNLNPQEKSQDFSKSPNCDIADKVCEKCGEFKFEIFPCLLNYLTGFEIASFSELIAQSYEFYHYPLDLLHIIFEYNDYRWNFHTGYTSDITDHKSYLLIVGHIPRPSELIKLIVKQLPYDEKCKNASTDRLKLLIARLVLITKGINSENLLKFYRNQNLVKLREQCEEEIKFMQEREIVDDCKVTFYDILTQNVKKVATYVRDENFLEIVESSYMKFPAYAEFLQLSVEKGKRRSELIDECLNSMFNLIEKNYKIQFTIIDIVKIFQYLSVRDLRRFLAAFS